VDRSLRIAVADDEPDMRDYYKTILPRLGHEVVAVAETGAQLVELCRQTNPDLVITDIHMPGMDGIDASTAIHELRPVPVILVSGYHNSELITRAEADHILAYLIKPIKQVDLIPTIALAMRRFEQFEQLRRESDGYRQALEDRKVIERAKGILMKRSSLAEDEAFRRLQKLASEKNMKLVELARMLTTADELLDAGV
jgi:response regulator NasT